MTTIFGVLSVLVPVLGAEFALLAYAVKKDRDYKRFFPKYP